MSFGYQHIQLNSINPWLDRRFLSAVNIIRSINESYCLYSLFRVSVYVYTNKSARYIHLNLSYDNKWFNMYMHKLITSYSKYCFPRQENNISFSLFSTTGKQYFLQLRQTLNRLDIRHFTQFDGRNMFY